tara:strand:+ start:753 stop:1532 length:780 start_codon:yes stop_codon:yes gene_type:complete
MKNNIIKMDSTNRNYNYIFTDYYGNKYEGKSCVFDYYSREHTYYEKLYEFISQEVLKGIKKNYKNMIILNSDKTIEYYCEILDIEEEYDEDYYEDGTWITSVKIRITCFNKMKKYSISHWELNYYEDWGKFLESFKMVSFTIYNYHNSFYKSKDDFLNCPLNFIKENSTEEEINKEYEKQIRGVLLEYNKKRVTFNGSEIENSFSYDCLRDFVLGVDETYGTDTFLNLKSFNKYNKFIYGIKNNKNIENITPLVPNLSS